MKKIYLLLAIFLISGFIFISFANAGYSNPGKEIVYSTRWDFSGSQISNVKYEPYPVNAGEYFDIWINAELGSATDYVKFEMLDIFPFSIDLSENPIREFKNLASNKIFMQYQVRVDRDAVEGVNTLYLKQITKEGSSDGTVYSFDIVVRDYRTDFDAVIHDVSGNDVAIAIANAGKNEADAVVVRIPQQEDFRIIGTDGQMVGSLGKGDYTLVGFNLEPKKENTEILEIDIYYTDALGERRVVNKELILETIHTSEKEEKEETAFYFEINISYYVIVALILIGISYYIYRKKIRETTSSKKKSTGIPEWIKKNKEK